MRAYYPNELRNINTAASLAWDARVTVGDDELRYLIDRRSDPFFDAVVEAWRHLQPWLQDMYMDLGPPRKQQQQQQH